MKKKKEFTRPKNISIKSNNAKKYSNITYDIYDDKGRSTEEEQSFAKETPISTKSKKEIFKQMKKLKSPMTRISPMNRITEEIIDGDDSPLLKKKNLIRSNYLLLMIKVKNNL